MPSNELTLLANRFGSDKGDSAMCAHGYTDIYETLLGAARDKPLRLLEIGLMHGHTQSTMSGHYEDIGCPSLRMWAGYLPAATVFGFDIVDFRSLSEARMHIFQGDQGNRSDLERMAEKAGGSFDVIIDDGSHASHHQQITLAALFPFLAPGGLYCIEDLHYQPEDLELPGISLTREFLRDLRFGRTGARVALEQHDIAYLLNHVRGIRFFDSQSSNWPLARREDALAVIVKSGTHPLLGDDLFGNHGMTAAAELDPRPPVLYTSVTGQFVKLGSAAAAPDTGSAMAWNSGTLSTPAKAPAGHYRPGDEIDFRLGGNAPLYQNQGWDLPSPGGTWTISPTAQLCLRLTEPLSVGQTLRMEILAQGLVGPAHLETMAEVRINGNLAGTLTFGYEQWQVVTYVISVATVSGEKMMVEFKTLNPASPHELGLSDDSRELGLLFSRARILLEE